MSGIDPKLTAWGIVEALPKRIGTTPLDGNRRAALVTAVAAVIEAGHAPQDVHNALHRDVHTLGGIGQLHQRLRRLPNPSGKKSHRQG